MDGGLSQCHYQGSLNFSLCSAALFLCLADLLGRPCVSFICLKVSSASLPTFSASGSTFHTKVPAETGILRSGSKREESPLASMSASLLHSLGANSTIALIPRCFINEASSISTAEEGNLVDMSLLRTAPLTRLSVIDGTMRTRISLGSGSCPNLILRATTNARASSVEIISDGRSPFSNTHGKSSLVISSENQEDFQVFIRPSSPRAGNHPPIPVRVPLA